jgi:type I restriction enzyme, S subunit
VTDGFHNTPPKAEDGYPYILATHVKSDKIDWKSCYYVDEKHHKELYNKTLPQKGEILLVNIGAGCGTPAIIDVDYEFSFKNVAILKFSQSLLFNQYLKNYFDLTREETYSELTKGGSQPFLSLKILNNIILPLPPTAEQQAIVSKAESLFEQIDQLHKLAQKKIKYRENTAKALFSKINTAANDTELQETWQLLNSNFKTVTQSKESVKQLRQSILQLAVQGKLTANWRKVNPNIEPASILLGKIKAEKEQLIKEGKIRREKPSPKISEDEKPFELPVSWEWVRLIDYGLTNTGTTPSKNNPEYFGKDYSFVKPAEISLKGINYATEDGLTELGIKQGRIIPENSILMVCIGGSIGKSFYSDRVVSCNQQINTITPLASISAELVNYFLQSVYFQFEIWDRASGATTPIINKGKWERIMQAVVKKAI